MPQWFREFLSPIVGWTSTFTAIGAGFGLIGAVFTEAPLASVFVFGLFLGAAGLTCGLAYSAVVLRGREPRAVAALPNAVGGAIIGVLPVVILATAAIREGSSFQNGVRDGLIMAALGAATAVFVRWRDRRRALAAAAREERVVQAPTTEAIAAPNDFPLRSAASHARDRNPADLGTRKP